MSQTPTEEVKTIYQRMAMTQAGLAPIVKDKTNPHFKNAYFDINDVIAVVKPVALENGLLWMQPLCIVDGRNAIRNVIVDIATGEKLEFDTFIPEYVNPQDFIKAVTYYRRGTAVPLWIIEGEADDDGNTATQASMVHQPVKFTKDIAGMTPSGAPNAATKRTESFQKAKDADEYDIPTIQMDEDTVILPD